MGVALVDAGWPPPPPPRQGAGGGPGLTPFREGS
jgi:hypothetical protein